MANKKDEVKTKVHAMSFDKQLFETLEDWRWNNRLTRTGAVNFILEKFFASLEKEKNPKQRELNLQD